MGCNLGPGKMWSSTRNPVDQIMGAKTNGRQVHFAVELLHIIIIWVNFVPSFYKAFMHFILYILMMKFE